MSHRNKALIALAALLGMAPTPQGSPAAWAAESNPSPSWREVREQTELAGRSGPGERYPVVARLRGGERFSVMLEDPMGWSAARLSDGATVWVSSAELAQATIPCTPPTASSDRPIPSPPQLAPEPNVAGGPGEGPIQMPTFTSAPPAEAASAVDLSQNWRPASGVRLRPSEAASSPFASPRDGRQVSAQLPEAASWPTHANSLGNNPPSISSKPPAHILSPVSTRQMLDRTEEHLTRMLAQDPLLWNLRPVEEALAYLTTQPLDLADVSRLKSLAERVAQARQIAKEAQSSQALALPPLQIPDVPPTGLNSPYEAAPISGAGGAATVIPPPATRLAAASPSGVESALLLRSLGRGGVASDLPESAHAELPKGDTGVAPVGFVTAPITESHPRPAEEIGAPQASRGLTPIPSREEIARELNALRRERFDAVGRLVRAPVRRPSDPPYLVVNERGEIEAYVKPAPGTLLRTYVGHQVGITGRKSRLPDGRGPFFIVDSVKLLDPPAASGGPLVSSTR